MEPEESDVCLIPDDPETEVTEAEKEQARENAEKAAEEEEAAEQSQSKSPQTEGKSATDAPVDPESEGGVGGEPTEESQTTGNGMCQKYELF